MINTTSRRDFLNKASLGALSLGFLACNSNTEAIDSSRDSSVAMAAKPPTNTHSLPSIGLQLWTVRDLIEKDLAGTLQQVAEVGFAGIETAFWPEGVSFEQGAKALQQAGLSVFAIHVDLPTGGDVSLLKEMSDAYQCKRLVWHGWPEDPNYRTLEGTQTLAKRYEDVHEKVKELGMSFGLHNHWWEFETMKDSDQTHFEWLLAHLNEDIFFELDTYWAKVAGRDPAALMAKWGSRAPLLHIKDGPATHDQPMTAVGSGVQDFPAIAEAGKGAIEWMIVEIDECATDMMEAVKKSYSYLQKHDLAVGKE